MEDIDQVTIGYAQMKALATGNPIFIERTEVDSELKRLQALYRAHTDKVYQMRRDITGDEARLQSARQHAQRLAVALADVERAPTEFQLSLDGRVFGPDDKRSEAGQAFMSALEGVTVYGTSREETVGHVRGFPIVVKGRGLQGKPVMCVRVARGVEVEVTPSESPTGNMTRLMNAVNSISEQIEINQRQIANLESRVAGLQEEVAKPFEHQARMAELHERLEELDAEIGLLEKEGQEKVGVATE
jgi:hypothetical protein